MCSLVPLQYKVVQGSTGWYKAVQNGTRTVQGGTRQYKIGVEQYIQVHTGTYCDDVQKYRKVHTGTYWNVLILFAQPGYACLLDSLLQFCLGGSAVFETNASTSTLHSTLGLLLALGGGLFSYSGCGRRRCRFFRGVPRRAGQGTVAVAAQVLFLLLRRRRRRWMMMMMTPRQEQAWTRTSWATSWALDDLQRRPS
jgi:hypothetical protein